MTPKIEKIWIIQNKIDGHRVVSEHIHATYESDKEKLQPFISQSSLIELLKGRIEEKKKSSEYQTMGFVQNCEVEVLSELLSMIEGE